MGTHSLRFSRRVCAIVLSLAIGAQAALADAALSTVWSERHHTTPTIESLPFPIPSLAHVSPSIEKNTPSSFSFAAAIPVSLGTLRFPGSSDAKRSVLLIQDVHLNTEAQANIAGAVSSLLRAGAIDMVGLEGASGPLKLESIAQAPDASSLTLAADFLLKEKLISGAARAALDPRVTTPLIGLDDDRLHEQNAGAYRSAAPLADAARKAIETRRSNLANSKTAAFNHELLSFDAAVTAFRSGHASFAAHAAVLKNAAEKNGTPVPAPLSLFVSLARLEKTIDTVEVGRERSMVIARLARVLNESQTRRLLDLGNAFRAGLVNHSSFYAEFGAICRSSGINLSASPALATYLRYVADADRIDPDATLRSAEELEAALYASLARSSDEKLIVKADRRTHLASRLASFEMTRPEWEEWTRDSTVDAQLPTLTDFEAFYRRAVERDAAIADNLISAMDQRRANRVAVVAGGFHAEGLVRRLAARGINAAVFTPAVSHADANGAAYLSVFSRAKTPIESLLEGRALFLAQNPIPPAAKFALVHLTAGRSIALGGSVPAQVNWIQRTLGWQVRTQSAARGQVTFEETDREGRAVRVVVDGASSAGFTSLPSAAPAVRQVRIAWTVWRAILVAQTHLLSFLSRILGAAANLLEPAPLTITAGDELRTTLVAVFTRLGQSAALKQLASMSDESLRGLDDTRKVVKAFRVNWKSGQVDQVATGVRAYKQKAGEAAQKIRMVPGALKTPEYAFPTKYVNTVSRSEIGVRAPAGEPAPGFRRIMTDSDLDEVARILSGAGIGMILDRNIAYVRHQMTRSMGEVVVARGLPDPITLDGRREMRGVLVIPDYLAQEVPWVLQNRLRDVYPAQILRHINESIELRLMYELSTPEWVRERIADAAQRLTDANLPPQNEETLRRVMISASLHEIGEMMFMVLEARAAAERNPEARYLVDWWRAHMWESSFGGATVKNYFKAAISDNYFDWESFADGFALYLEPNGILHEFGDTLPDDQREFFDRFLRFVRSEEQKSPGGFFSVPMGAVDDHHSNPPPSDAGGFSVPLRPPTRTAPQPPNTYSGSEKTVSTVPRTGRPSTSPWLAVPSAVVDSLARSWRAAVVEVRRTLNPFTFVLRDHRNVEFLGIQKRAVGVSVIYTAMIWAPLKLGVFLAASTAMDPSLIAVIAILSIPAANIIAHGSVNTLWLAVSPAHRLLTRLSDELESVALRTLTRSAARAFEPAPLTMDNPDPYQVRLHDYLATISSPGESINQSSQEFNALADETEMLIQGPKERGRIFEAWASAVTQMRFPLEKFLAAFLRRWIGREPHVIFTWMREIVTVLARHAEDTRTTDLQRLVTESFADAAAQLQDEIFHEHSSRKESQPIRLVEITPEVAPFRKAGGMGMVNGILPLEFNKFHGWATTISMRYDDGDYTGEEIVTVDGRRGSPPLRFTVEIPGEPKARVATVTKIRRYSADGLTFADYYFFRDTTRGPTNLTQSTYMLGASEELKIKQGVFLSEGSLQLMKMLVKSAQMKKPDIVRGHDWQAGLALIFMKTRSYAEDPDMRDVLRGVKTMAFFHNLEPGYRGEFPMNYWYLLGLRDQDKQGFGWDHAVRREDGGHRIEGFNENTMMVTKAMAHHVDAMFVPAPTYALMVQTPEYGHEMWSMFSARHDALRGVLNGTDYDQSAQKIFPMGPRTLQDFVDHKRRAKITLLKELRPPSDDSNKPNPTMWEQIEKGVKERLGPNAQDSDIEAAMQREIDRPIVGAVVRLDVAMKGTNMYLALVRRLAQEHDGHYIRFVLMGMNANADHFISEMKKEAAAAPDRVFFLPEGGKGLSHAIRDINLGGPILSLNNLIEAGIDIPAYPSKVEPCGLSDVQGLNRGGVVVVSAAGGFKDKNVDIAEERDDRHATGVMFGPVFGDDRPTLKAISSPFTDDGFVATVERLLDVYYNDRGHFDRIAADNANLRFTNEDMARGHITSLAYFLGRKDIEENPQKPFRKLALGAVAAWRSIGIRNPVFIGVLEGALTILSIAVAVSALMPLGPPAASAIVNAAWLAGSTVLATAGALSVLWAAHHLGGVIETDGSISIGDRTRATAATMTAASGLIGLPLLLVPFLLGDAVTAWHFFVAAAALGAAAHGAINAVRLGQNSLFAKLAGAPLLGVAIERGKRNSPDADPDVAVADVHAPAVNVYEDDNYRRRISLDSIPFEARVVIEHFRDPAFGGRVGIAGGFVRDLLLGRPFNDIDVVVPRGKSDIRDLLLSNVFPGQDPDLLSIEGHSVELMPTNLDDLGRMTDMAPEFSINRMILQFDEHDDPYILDGEDGYQDLFPQSGPVIGTIVGDPARANMATISRLVRRAADENLRLHLGDATMRVVQLIADKISEDASKDGGAYGDALRAELAVLEQWRIQRKSDPNHPPFDAWDTSVEPHYRNRDVAQLHELLKSYGRTVVQSIWSLHAILQTSSDANEAARAIEALSVGIYADEGAIDAGVVASVIDALNREAQPKPDLDLAAIGFFSNIADRMPSLASPAMFETLEEMLGRKASKERDLQSVADAIKELINARPDLATRGTVTALENFMTSQGHDPASYFAVATALADLAAARADLIVRNSPTSVLLSFPEQLRRHSFGHYRIYNHVQFPAGTTPNHRYSVGLAAERILARHNQPLTDESGQRAVDAIEAERARISGNVVAGPGYRVVRATHMEDRFDADRLERIATRSGIPAADISPAYRGKADKDRILDDVRNTKGNLVFMFAGHGSEKHIWLEAGHAGETQVDNFTFDRAINFEELGDALLKNAHILPDRTGLDLSHVTLLIDTCHSYNFAAYLLHYLEKNGVKVPPVTVSSANVDRFSFDSTLFEELDALNHQGPMTMGHLFATEEAAFGNSGFTDFGIFTAESPALAAAIGGVSTSLGADLGLAGITVRVLNMLGIRNAASVATIGGLVESAFILAVIPIIAAWLGLGNWTPLVQLLAFPAIHFLGGAQTAVRTDDGAIVLQRRSMDIRRLLGLSALGLVFHLLIPSGIAGAAAHAAFNLVAVALIARPMMSSRLAVSSDPAMMLRRSPALGRPAENPAVVTVPGPAVDIYADDFGRRRIRLSSVPEASRNVLERVRDTGLHGHIFVTGGFVRDLMLGRDFRDVDLVVPPRETDLSNELENLLVVMEQLFPNVAWGDDLQIEGRDVDVILRPIDNLGNITGMPTNFSFNHMILAFDGADDPFLLDPEGGFYDLFPERGPRIGHIARASQNAEPDTLERLMRHVEDADLGLRLNSDTLIALRRLRTGLGIYLHHSPDVTDGERTAIADSLDRYDAWHLAYHGNPESPPFERFSTMVRMAYDGDNVDRLSTLAREQSADIGRQAIWALQSILRITATPSIARRAIDGMRLALRWDGARFDIQDIESVIAVVRGDRPGLNLISTASEFLREAVKYRPDLVPVSAISALEDVLGQKGHDNDEYEEAAAALAAALRQRPAAATPALVATIEDFVKTEGYDPGAYAAVGAIADIIRQQRPELMIDNPATQMMLSFPFYMRRHSFSHFQIYNYGAFGPRSAPEHRYTVGLAAYRLIQRRGQTLTEENVRNAVASVVRERRAVRHDVLIGPEQHVIRALHSEARFDPELLARVSRTAGVAPANISLPYKGASSKNFILEDIETTHGPIAFLFNGHGSAQHIWLDNGLPGQTNVGSDWLPEAIHFEELGNAFLRNAPRRADGPGLDLSHVTLIIESCHSYNFVVNFLNYLRNNGVTRAPSVVASSNSDRYSLGESLFNALDVNQPRGPVTMGRVFDAEKERFRAANFSDFAVFTNEGESLSRSSEDGSIVGYVELGLAGVTRRVLEAVGLRNAAVIATAGGILESVFVLAVLPILAGWIGVGDATPILQLLAFPTIHFLGGAQVAVRRADGTVALESRPVGLKALLALTVLGAIFHLLIPSGIGGAAAHAAFNFVAVAIASRGTPATPESALGLAVAQALIERTPLGPKQRAWAAALEGDLNAQSATVGVNGMAERPLPSLAPMERRDFDQAAFLNGLRINLEAMNVVHQASPAQARAAAEAVALTGISRETAQTSLNSLDESRLNIVVFDGMREDDAARTIDRIRSNPAAEVIVVHDPANEQTRAFVDAAAVLPNVTMVAETNAFETAADGGRKLLLKRVESRLMSNKLIAPSLHIFAGKGLELDTDGLSDNSPFRAALYTILDAMLSVTANFNRISLMDASYKLISSQA